MANQPQQPKKQSDTAQAPPAPPVAPPAAPQPQRPKKPAVEGVTPDLLAYVAKAYPGHTITAVGKTQMIVHDGNPAHPGVKVQIPTTGKA